MPKEAALAAVSSLVWFVVFSTQAAMIVGKHDHFPTILRLLFAATVERGQTRKWLSGMAAGVFAAIGQAPVFVVAIYRGGVSDPVAQLLLVGETIAVFAWVLLLRHWVRSSARV